jgi:hypothetical protein
MILIILDISEDGLKRPRALQDIKFQFSRREELVGTLRDRKDHEFSDSILNIIKEFITRYTVGDFERTLFKNLFKYCLELYRKLNVRNTMASTKRKEKEI